MVLENRLSLKHLSTLTSFIKKFTESFYVQKYNLSPQDINNLKISSIKVALAHHQHATIYILMIDYNGYLKIKKW